VYHYIKHTHITLKPYNPNPSGVFVRNIRGMFFLLIFVTLLKDYYKKQKENNSIKTLIDSRYYEPC
jgi:fluoride ion exporter CrcB/FEX